MDPVAFWLFVVSAFLFGAALVLWITDFPRRR
jgi:hypothetical protein